VTPRRFLDTNILIYSISTAPADAAKRERAIGVIDEGDCGLSVQVLQEFYVQATRPTRPGALTHDQAAGLVEAWMRLPVQETTIALLRGALDIRGRYGFSYWDSAVVAAARALGCRELLTEDLSDGRELEGIVIVDPFRDLA
jgi:predicted nucleic acid-binding protein